MRQQVAQVKAGLDVAGNVYLRALADGALTRAQFVETQLQFLAAVREFPKAMALLAARVPEAATRVVLEQNIQDELGAGRAEDSHVVTFQTLLSRLGADAQDVDTRIPGPEVHAFNQVVRATCALDDVATALAMLGMIEDLFSDISGRIGRGIVSNTWLPADQVTHYPTHEVVDVGHAEAFYRCLDAQSPALVQQGLDLGAYIFLRLYEDLHRARDRRPPR